MKPYPLILSVHRLFFPFFNPANSALLKKRHSPGVIPVRWNFVTGFKYSLLHMSHHGLLSGFSHSQISPF